MSAPIRRPRARALLLGLALGAAVVALLRLWALDADPPRWLPDATVVDEALWADGARGQALFGDWFADDTGNAWLAAPIYNLIVLGSYETFGVSLWATRLVPALASLLLLAVVAHFAWRRFGRDGLWATAVLALCPFLWAHSRFGLLEVPQAAAVTASFALLFGRPHAGWARALGAGVCMGIAVGIKPNAIVFGVAPLGIAWAARWWNQRTSAPAHLRDALGAVIGGSAVLAGIAALVWLPHSEWTLETWRAEGGMANGWWGDHLLRLGFFASREGYPGTHALWGPLRSAPAITTAAWAYGLWAAVRLGATQRPLRDRLADWEWPVLAWAIAAFFAAEFSYQQVARRAVHILVPMLLLGTHWWIQRRDRSAAMSGLFLGDRRHPALRAALWVLLTAPALVASKPQLCNALRASVGGWFGPDADKTRVAGATGLVVLGAWLLAVALLTASRFDPHRLAQRFALRIAPTAVLLLLLVEGLMIVQHLAMPRWTILDAQRQAANLVGADECVFGSYASLLFQARPVRTVRWVRTPDEFYSGPRPNPDAFAEHAPRYIVTAVDRDKREPSYALVVDNLDPAVDARFEPIAHIQFITEPGDYPRFVLQLWRRIDGR